MSPTEFSIQNMIPQGSEVYYPDYQTLRNRHKRSNKQRVNRPDTKTQDARTRYTDQCTQTDISSLNILLARNEWIGIKLDLEKLQRRTKNLKAQEQEREAFDRDVATIFIWLKNKFEKDLTETFPSYNFESLSN
jgi:hypothetical protein